MVIARDGAVPVVVVSGGRQGLAVARALGEAGVPVVIAASDDEDVAVASRYVVASVRTPVPDTGDRAFVDALLHLSERWAGSVLMPVTDEAVSDVARAKEELSERYVVDCPDWPSAQLFIDKRYTYEIAERAGIDVPLTEAPSTRAEALEAARRVGYPCLVKPRQVHLYRPHFGRKLTLVHDRGELMTAFDEAHAFGVEVLVQELVPGEDELGINYNSFWDGGRLVAECTARKLRLSPPRFGYPRALVSELVADALEPGRAIAQALGIDGFACTEFKRDPRTGAVRLLEVNGRHNHSSLLSLRSGINFAALSYAQRTGGPVPPQQAAYGLYWIDEFADVHSAVSRSGRDGRSLAAMAEPWRGAHVLAVWDRSDAAPFWAHVRHSGTRLRRRLLEQSGSAVAASRSRSTAGSPT